MNARVLLDSASQLLKRVSRHCMWLALALLLVPGASAQQTDSPQAPVPSQILSSKAAFIANSGGDCNPLGNTGYTGGPDRPYNQFWAAMKSWGRYEFVSNPADAALIFEIRFTCPLYFDEKLTRIDAEIRLLVRDPKTQTVLWGFTEHIDGALRQSARDKNFDKALANLVDDVRKLVVRPDAVVAGATP